MNIISQGKMFLSDQRSIIESERIKRYSTFNFENIYNAAKEPIGNLYALHDDMLAPNASINFFHREQGHVIIVPILGSVSFLDDNEKETSVEVGKGKIIFLEANTFFKLKNPNQDASINYLIIGIKNEITQAKAPKLLDIDLSTENLLKAITPNSAPFKISLGRFHGRGESNYELNTAAILYSFVLSGAFEIDGRLLHERDGIALWATKKIEIEALSNQAILLTIELPSPPSTILF